VACNEFVLKDSYHKFKAFKDWMLLLEDESKTNLHFTPWSFACLNGFILLPEEIPSRLPPKRDIQHHIDLIPRAILPCKLAYRMNPKGIVEVQRHVEELISKGLLENH